MAETQIHIACSSLHPRLLLIAFICWNIWPKRNNRIFNNVTHKLLRHAWVKFILTSYIGHVIFPRTEELQSQETHGGGHNQDCQEPHTLIAHPEKGRALPHAELHQDE